MARHHLSFEDARTVFAGPLRLEIADPDHSDEEDRNILGGRSAAGRLLLVSHTDRGDVVRIISAGS
jgi:uncharacterized DUF497 family protein